MKIQGTLALIAFSLFSTLSVQAATKPTPDEINRVYDYFKNGSDIILAESKFCDAVQKSGDNKNDCQNELPAPIPKKTKGLLWMNFMVPGNQHPTLLIQFKYKGRALDSDEIHVSNAFRYRTWKILPTSKAGDWEVTIEQETDNGYTPVAKLNYTVTE